MTEPLTPVDCDLKDFPYMQLHVARLRDSDLAAYVDPEACWYAVLLWAASWHQIPAASVPDDDRVLAKLCGLGRDVATFQRLREGALHGFIKCDDGRLYHPIVAEQANDAWAKKCGYRGRKEKRAEAARKAALARWSASDSDEDRMRDASQSDTCEAQSASSDHASDMPIASQNDANAMRNASDQHAERIAKSVHDHAQRMPPAMRDASQSQCRKEEGEEEGELIPLSNENGRAAKIPDPAKIMFDAGIALLMSAGTPEKQARNWLGRARQKHGAETVIAAIGQAKREGAIEPIGFMEGCFKSRTRQGADHEIPFV